MHHIKLSAIDSTNDYLKRLNAAQQALDFTVVTALEQTAGRGQQGAQWKAESGKNLMMSLLLKDLNLESTALFALNCAVALSIVRALQKRQIPELSIKWPNDIMSAKKKIGGILIENTLKTNGSLDSIIGIGLNVNQTDFEGLPRASSLKNATGQEFDLDALLTDIVDQIGGFLPQIKNPAQIWQDYHELLFRKNIPTAFETPDGSQFMGIIQGVNEAGQLQVVLEDDSVACYGIREISMLF